MGGCLASLFTHPGTPGRKSNRLRDWGRGQLQDTPPMIFLRMDIARDCRQVVLAIS